MKCCPPPSDRDKPFTPQIFESSLKVVRPDSVLIPGGVGLTGTSYPMIRSDGEGPLRESQLKPLHMSRGSITNTEFAAFVDHTGYITEAEHFGWSFVFWSQVPDYVGPTQSVPNLSWWRRVDGACWKHISGPKCSLADSQPDHPVVHVSWNDAKAYCSWVGGRLPTECEWEHAARGGLGDVRFPWGNTEPDDIKSFPCNIWQGEFPHTNTAMDGYQTTAPAVSFAPNGYGLYNMVGNVWDWTAGSFRKQSQSLQPSAMDIKVAKGGSFLCHKSYCYRYRIAARIGNPSDSTTTHMGFRVVWD